MGSSSHDSPVVASPESPANIFTASQSSFFAQARPIGSPTLILRDRLARQKEIVSRLDKALIERKALFKPLQA